MRVAIRVDVSTFIGVGHFVRCRSLARELSRKGAEIKFVHRQIAGDLAATFSGEFDLLSLPEAHIQIGQVNSECQRDAAWLDTSQEIDAEETSEILGQFQPDWMIVDHYGLDSEWEKLIRSKGMKILVIDDLADRQHDCDILLDQNWYGLDTKIRYTNLVPTQTKLLLGPWYALLDREYAHLRSSICRSHRSIERIVIHFGGNDRTNLTGKVLDVFDCEEFRKFELDIVIGSNSRFLDDVIKKSKMFPNSKLHTTLPSLARLIAQADLVIGAGGASTWERSCLGLPSIVITNAVNQERHCKCLAEEDAIILHGKELELNPRRLRKLLQEMVADTSKLWEISNNSRRLTDGHGAKRVVSNILPPKEPISLRVSKDSDEDLLLRWANESAVRQNSFSSDVITQEEHQKWYAKILVSDNSHIFMAETSDGLPVGQVRFDKDPISGNSRLGYSIDKDFRGIGLGKKLVEKGISAIRNAWGPVTVVAEIFQSNVSSNAVIQSLGFEKISTRADGAGIFILRG